MFVFYHDYSLIQSLTRTDGLRTPSSRVISMHLLGGKKYAIVAFSVLIILPRVFFSAKSGCKITAFLRPAQMFMAEKCKL